jgi:hypothetical protein
VDTAYISAGAALAGSLIGGLTSLATSWLTQRTQARAGEATRNRRRRQRLYRKFIDEASRLYINALVHDEVQASERAAELVKIYSVISQMRTLSSRRVILAAENIGRKIVDTAAAPKKTVPELQVMLHQDAVDPLREFSEACRAEFEALGSALD